jgi:hypothetical protein
MDEALAKNILRNLQIITIRNEDDHMFWKIQFVFTMVELLFQSYLCRFSESNLYHCNEREDFYWKLLVLFPIIRYVLTQGYILVYWYVEA